MAEAVKWDSVQALVRYGFKHQDHARYVLFEIDDPVRAKHWLRDNQGKFSYAVKNGNMLPRAGDGPDGSQQYHCNIAFTHDGLQSLGVRKNTLASFSAEFREGMVGPSNKPPSSRSAKLGDTGLNDPREWQWGGARSHPEPVHMLLMVFADSKTEAAFAVADVLRPGPEAHGLRLIETLTSTMNMQEPREHFGFLDGISQPVIDDPAIRPKISPTNRTISTVKPGEFIMGYRNEREVTSVSPIVSAADKGNDKLPRRGSAHWDLGKNGTYLVFRQLRQDVQKFDDFLEEQFKQQPRGVNATLHRWLHRGAREWKKWLAAKMVGRWQSGMPLAVHPDDDPRTYDPYRANDFFFADSDPYGIKCPTGSHIRRANPRDSLEKDQAHALRVSKHRRIIRRGRIYGSRYDEDNPDDGTGPNERGLLFICLNASIAGQFESIQHDWLNSPQFAELYEETDPLVGTRSQADHVFTVPARPANIQFSGISQFVTVRGGAYFFLPSKQAIDWLAHL